MSPTTIRIAVVADVDNPFAPGLFQGSVDAVNGAAKSINSEGGIGGRKVQVDFIDSKLDPNDVAQRDHHRVSAGPGARWHVGAVPLERRRRGQLQGPEGPGHRSARSGGHCHRRPTAVFASVVPGDAPQLLCATKDRAPQTYQGNQGDSKYYLKHFGKNLHGVYVLPNDTKDANRGDAVPGAIAVQAGIKADQSPTRSGRDPQSAYTPIIQGMKTASSNYAFDGLAYSNVIELRQEAQLQGLTDPKIIWACTTACYDPAT